MAGSRSSKVPTRDRTWKRSWKNLLLNKRYQLRFTLFMVIVSGVLMLGLGEWVMKKASEATQVAISAVQGEACPKIPVLSDLPSDDGATPLSPGDGGGGGSADDAAGSAAAAPVAPAAPSSVDPSNVAKHNAQSDVVTVANLWCVHPASCTPAPAEAEPLVIKAPGCDAYVRKNLADPAYAEALRKATISIVRCAGGQTFTVADGQAEPAEHHVNVQIDESSMTLTPTVPNDYADRVVSHWQCEMRQLGAIDELHRGERRILWVLIGTGLVLVLGLAIYGIKMTHRVAGPLFKVSLYLAKMRDGRFDKVYNLRKGDQLVEFYEHFKAAHAGVVKLEREDIDHVKAVIAAAEGAGEGHSEAVAELKKLVERKEKSVE